MIFKLTERNNNASEMVSILKDIATEKKWKDLPVALKKYKLNNI